MCVLDKEGRSQFNRLLFRRGTPVFAAFDLLGEDGLDLRQLPLLERKRRLRAVVPRHSGSILYVSHIATHGVALFNEVCARDLEGTVAKWAAGSYISDGGGGTSWLKIKNTSYSQVMGRRDLFEDCRPRRKAMPKARRLVLA